MDADVQFNSAPSVEVMYGLKVSENLLRDGDKLYLGAGGTLSESKLNFSQAGQNVLVSRSRGFEVKAGFLYQPAKGLNFGGMYAYSRDRNDDRELNVNEDNGSTFWTGQRSTSDMHQLRLGASWQILPTTLIAVDYQHLSIGHLKRDQIFAGVEQQIIKDQSCMSTAAGPIPVQPAESECISKTPRSTWRIRTTLSPTSTRIWVIARCLWQRSAANFEKWRFVMEWAKRNSDFLFVFSLALIFLLGMSAVAYHRYNEAEYGHGPIEELGSGVVSTIGNGHIALITPDDWKLDFYHVERIANYRAQLEKSMMEKKPVIIGFSIYHAKHPFRRIESVKFE